MSASVATILIVDDERQNRKLLEALLEPEGYRTVSASSGIEALACIATHPPDLILVDIMMPGMDGYEVTSTLKSDPVTSNIPIIMVTAQTDRSARLAGLNAGAEDFLTKPVDRAELWLRVRNLLRLRRTQEALERARDEANLANRAKSEFLSRMSHELRTPLNAVLGFTQILLMDELTVEQRENMDFIRQAGRHLLGLIDDVLDIAQIESGGLRVSLEPVQVVDVVGAAVDLVRLQAEKHGVRLEVLADDPAIHVRADRQRIVQVLLNLLSNAVKYNRLGGLVTVRCERSGGTVLIAVQDNGIGMTADGLSKLFTPFERLGAENTDVEGTGVGMALSRVLSQQMGGSLTVFSTVGVGTTFSLELPESEAADLATPSEATVNPPRTTTPGSLSVLCFEDNVANVRLMERALHRLPNVALVTAEHGWEGLDIARRDLPDLVLLDLQLPDMPGEDVLRILRADPTTAATPVFVTTADATVGQAERLLALGATAYLTKPIDLVVLYELIERVRSGPAIVDLSTPTPRIS